MQGAVLRKIRVEKDIYYCIFLHQDFRDYFAAIYIKDRTQEKINARDNTFPELASCVFNIHLKNMLGELTEETRRRPVIKGGEYKKGEIKETILDKALDLLRNEEIKNDDFRILNILEVLKEKRVDLSDTNLSYLDLRQVILNNIRLGYRNLADEIKSVILRESKIIGDNFFPQGHTGAICIVCYNPEGDRVFSGSDDKTIKEWDIKTGKCIKTYRGHLNSVLSISCHPKMKKIISGSSDKTIKEWDTKTGKCIKTYKESLDTNVSYHPSGKKFITSGTNYLIKEWDVNTGKCIKTYSGHTSLVNCLCYSPDGNKFISGSTNKTIKEWDIESGKCIKNYEGHTEAVLSVDYSIDGKKIVSGSADKTVKEWDVKIGKCINTYTEHNNYVFAVKYGLKENDIFSASYDGLIIKWITNSSDFVKVYQYKPIFYHTLKTIDLHPYEEKIISGYFDGNIKELSIQNKICIKTYEARYDLVSFVGYNSDGNKIILRNAYNQECIYDYNTGKCLEISDIKDRDDNKFSPDKKKMIFLLPGNEIREMETTDYQCINIYEGHSASIITANYNADGRKIISGSHDKTIKEWNTTTRECIRTYEGHSAPVSYVNYNSEEDKIISGSSNGVIKEWDIKSGRCIRTYEGHSNTVLYISYSPNGAKIISGSDNGTIKEWNVVTGKCIKTIKNIPGLFIQGVDMRNLHPTSKITPEEKEILQQYGAII